jgi:hypothetical protein
MRIFWIGIALIASISALGLISFWFIASARCAARWTPGETTWLYDKGCMVTFNGTLYPESKIGKLHIGTPR